MENYSYNSYPESGDSSPRSREIEFENPLPWDDSQGNQLPPNFKVKFMCSYGGKIHPRPHDNQLSYMGGETKILSVDRNTKFASLLSKLTSLCDSENISFKYQLPGEDLDALISVTNDDDLEHMMHEYERLYRISPKQPRLRIFIFPTLNQSLSSSTRSFGSDDAKSEKERFVEALNSAPIITAPPAVSHAAPQPQAAVGNVDFLFGLEKANAMAAQAPAQPVVGRNPVPEMEDPVYIPGSDERFMVMDPIQKHIQDLQRLRLEEQQQQQAIHQKKSEDNFGGGYAGREYYKPPEKAPSPVIQGGVPYWTDKQGGGVIPTGTVANDQAVYMIPAQAGAYQAPMMRQMTGAPAQGFYAVQRMPSEVYREQQHMYNVVPQAANLQQQKAPGPPVYSEGYGMVRPATSGGMGVVTDTGYAQVAYDGGMGRQVLYTAPGGMMGAPQVQTAPQYQAIVGGMTVDMRPAGALNSEAAVRGVQNVTQTSL